MKTYIITVIGATLLSALAGMLSPEKWRGYIKIITGLVAISCIASPVLTAIHSDIFHGFDESFEIAAAGEDLQLNIVRSELEKRINKDIEARMKNEFNLSVRAECEILLSDEGAVEGVRRIYIYGDSLTGAAVNRLCEVYGLERSGVHYE